MMELKPIVLLAALVFGVASCASQPQREHGKLSDLTIAGAASLELCEHRVPGDTCTRCHPELEPRFKEVGDWCVEHGIPESQCLECHPDLSFEPLPELPPEADVKKLSAAGEDVPSLEDHAVLGKVTIFDFYADWCAPCRKVDAHVFALLQKRKDLALRKLNVVSWETPLAKRHLTKVSTLPHLVVFGADGKKVAEVTGFDLDALDAAIAKAAQ